MVRNMNMRWGWRVGGVAACLLAASWSSARADEEAYVFGEDEAFETPPEQSQELREMSGEPISTDPWAEHRYIDRYSQVEYDPYRDPTNFEDDRDFTRVQARAEFERQDRPAGSGWDYGWHFDPTDNQWRYGWHNETARHMMPARTYTERTTATWHEDADQYGTSGEQIRITGFINTIDVQGPKESGRVIAEIETHDGETLRVDLGPRKSVDRLNLNEGARVTVLTNRAALRGGSLVAADRVITDNQVMLVDRDGAAFGTTGGRQIRGEIEEIYVRDILGAPHYVAKIETRDNDEMTVVLGSQRDFADVRIEEGDEITLVGAPRYLEGRQMFVAERVHTPDRIVRVYVPQDRYDENPRYQRRFTEQQFSGREYDTQDDRRFQERPSTRFERDSFSTGRQASFDQQQRISGEITSLRTRNHQGHQHLIAMVQTDNGNMIQADLGNRENVRQLNPMEGDYITLFGSYTTQGGRSLFAAERLTLNGENVFIDVDDLFKGASMQREVRPVSGEITDLRTERVDGSQQAKLVAHITTDEGKTKKVILGSASQLRNLNLNTGDRVRLMAAPGDREYMKAKEIHTGGRIITVRDNM